MPLGRRRRWRSPRPCSPGAWKAGTSRGSRSPTRGRGTSSSPRPSTRTVTAPSTGSSSRPTSRRGRRREFALSPAEPSKPRREDYRVYARFVRERHDDFAWENDRVAFRLYGPALETFEKEPLTSSAVDAWSKRTSRLVLNDWYLVDDYHRDHGEGGDFYPAGKSPRLRRQRARDRRGARRLEELPRVAGARDRAPPCRLRGLLPRVGEAGAEGERGEARHPRRGSPLQPVRELLHDGRRPSGHVGRRAFARPRASLPASIATAASCGRGSTRTATARTAGSAADWSSIRRQSWTSAEEGGNQLVVARTPKGAARDLVRGLRLGPQRRLPRRSPRGTGTWTRSPRGCDRRSRSRCCRDEGPPPRRGSRHPRPRRRLRASARGPVGAPPRHPRRRPGPGLPGSRVPRHRFGAVADGQGDATDAFRAAIGACHRAGGGRVVVPPGVFLTGPIHLKSGRRPARVRGRYRPLRRDPAAYLPVVLTRWEGVELMSYSPLVYAFEQQDIAITGKGTLDGQADAEHWWPWKRNGHPESQKPDRDRLFAQAEAGGAGRRAGLRRRPLPATAVRPALPLHERADRGRDDHERADVGDPSGALAQRDRART